MPKFKAIEVLKTDLHEHPAVLAWKELGPNRSEPDRIAILKRGKKSLVCRLEGVGSNGDSHVIAKRCRHETARVERAIYEEILPNLPVSALHYYGAFEEPHGRGCWLFIENASGEKFLRGDQQHRELAASWLGKLHTSATSLAAAVHLPDRGPDHYLDLLRAARDMMQQHFSNPVLTTEDRELLCKILSQLDMVESNWNQLQTSCENMPKTLVHGDFAGHNVAVRWRPEGPVLALYDWEMAGWGVPATDLLSIDPLTYHRAVREHWPQLNAEELQDWIAVGKLFRGSIAPITWQSYLLKYEWAHAEMRAMRVFHASLREAIQTTGLNGDNAVRKRAS